MKKNTHHSSWFLLGLGIALPMAASRLTKSLAGEGYRIVTREDPPQNPAAPEVAWKDAIVWSVVTGVVGGLTRLVTRRALAESFIPTEGYDFEEAARELEEAD